PHRRRSSSGPELTLRAMSRVWTAQECQRILPQTEGGMQRMTLERAADTFAAARTVGRDHGPRPVSNEHSFSARLSIPFLRVLSGHLPADALAKLAPRDPDARMPASSCMAMLDAAVGLTRDPDLGLRAALSAPVGEYDLLEYTATSSASIADSVP